MRGLYQRVLLPRLIDLAMRGDELNALRKATLSEARGRVLEVGFGTGLNARHYPRGVELTVIDDNPGMRALATRRLAQAKRDAQLTVLSGESLPFDAGSFDTVVVTFTLCSIADVDRALLEMKRVLLPGGQLLFLEHGAAADANVLRWQRRLTPLWRVCAGGCHLDRDPAALLKHAGFDVTVLESTVLPTGALAGSVRRGVARPH